MKMFARAALAAAMLAAVPLAVAQPAAAQGTVKFGALYPFSGTLALLGDESFRGFELAVEERNAAGGLNGQKIEFIKGDAVDPNQAVGEARRLTSVDKVSAIFGTYSSSLSLAATQVTELANVPYFELGAISDPITERGFKYVFRTNATARDFANRMVDSIIEAIAPALNAKPGDLKIGIIHEDSLYGQTVSGYQKSRAKEKGLNVVEVLPYSAKSVDLTPVILRLKSAGADVVLQTSYQNDTVLFFRQMKDQGYKPKAVMGAGGGYSTRDTMQAVGAENMEGALDVDFTQYNTNPKAAPGITEFAAKYKAKYGIEPRSGHSLANYMGAKVFFDAIASAKSTDADKVRAAVLAVDIPVGQTATGWGAKFSEQGQNTRAVPFLMQWQGGNLVTVFPVDAAVAKMKTGIGAN
ncbi:MULTISPECIES: ABC transporter substrate-binding protein [Xanthobacter]|uniref:ABC transporter substrate-binding protein n=1 Tax=Xanthobacter TaxID=279 RepID=UPI00145DC645|nr:MULTISPECIES: ABC transporter substrate-binding protein [Xanthobacter]MBN8915858.1 ABC transporter substrate-binding protein [Hyphomicrobiales bacterium]NMN58323.1 branched-chain amino acid transport system substrate-binding protein [Xanthobacter sp. SG618]UDQ90538.1 ABC transporter substrate-binding protein [Xanthobacter autotrophicus]UJX44408.1 amino acid-binding protein [Xanthobacter sp. YC-JY1]